MFLECALTKILMILLVQVVTARCIAAVRGIADFITPGDIRDRVIYCLSDGRLVLLEIRGGLTGHVAVVSVLTQSELLDLKTAAPSLSKT